MILRIALSLLLVNQAAAMFPMIVPPPFCRWMTANYGLHPSTKSKPRRDKDKELADAVEEYSFHYSQFTTFPTPKRKVQSVDTQITAVAKHFSNKFGADWKKTGEQALNTLVGTKRKRSELSPDERESADASLYALRLDWISSKLDNDVISRQIEGIEIEIKMAEAEIAVNELARELRLLPLRYNNRVYTRETVSELQDQIRELQDQQRELSARADEIYFLFSDLREGGTYKDKQAQTDNNMIAPDPETFWMSLGYDQAPYKTGN